ncbi:type II toxin-antitoxin system VapC family toxin [Pleurocapsa sp. FMAR1]|uniref:type II toxin-antitoxin system VapC family toxin n=1 Tax=Pleurocapsa sp. FMAR1 TaxID=3040204 RepID=UPI0029C842B8|nr:type II toxin-antitoxin system VapC family toxin [Pleurocapsa sp. FMAR1]
MYLIDTKIAFLKGNSNTAVVNQFQSKHQDCYLSTLVLAELYKGVYCSSKFEKNITALNQFTSSLPKVDYDQKAALEFGKIQAQLRRKGKPTGEIDALIAAVARSRQDILVTNNTRHFINITGLQLEDWLNS